MRNFLALSALLLVARCRGNPLQGDFNDVEPSKEDVQLAANEAAKHLSSHFADEFHHTLVQVLKAEEQVVTSKNYKIKIVVGKTTCEKNEMDFDQTKDCGYQEKSDSYKFCDVVVNRDSEGHYTHVSSGCIFLTKKDRDKLFPRV